MNIITLPRDYFGNQEADEVVVPFQRLPPGGYVSLDTGEVVAPKANTSSAAQPPSHATALPLVKFDDASATFANPYLVEDLIDEGAASMLYGDTNTGKTFVALDLALHIATGRPWFGRKVRQGAVVYIAAEAGKSAQRRVAAWRKHHGVPSAACWLIPYPVDLLHKDGDSGRLVDAIKLVKREADAAGLKIALIVVDTVARALAGGNENSPDDMGALVRSTDALRIVSGAHLMVVHHIGKDPSKGARGHTSLKAAVDTELEISDHAIKTTKQRDMESASPIKFGLKVVELGVDEDGKRMTSCVVGPPEPFGFTRAPMSDKELAAFEVLEELIEQRREKARNKDSVGAPMRDWLSAYARKDGAAFKDTAELRKSATEMALRRVASSLKAKGWIRKNSKNEYAVAEDVTA